MDKMDKMDKIDHMDQNGLVIVGPLLLLAAVVCPIPSMFGISWAVWRIGVGVLACVLTVRGVLGTVRARKKRGNDDAIL